MWTFLKILKDILEEPKNSFLIGAIAGFFTVIRLALHFFERTKTYSIREAKNFILVAATMCVGWSVLELAIIGQTVEAWKSIALTYLITGAIVVGHYGAVVLIQLAPNLLYEIEDTVLNFFGKNRNKKNCNQPCTEEKTYNVIKEVLDENADKVKVIMNLL